MSTWWDSHPFVWQNVWHQQSWRNPRWHAQRACWEPAVIISITISLVRAEQSQSMRESVIKGRHLYASSANHTSLAFVNQLVALCHTLLSRVHLICRVVAVSLPSGSPNIDILCHHSELQTPFRQLFLFEMSTPLSGLQLCMSGLDQRPRTAERYSRCMWKSERFFWIPQYVWARSTNLAFSNSSASLDTGAHWANWAERSSNSANSSSRLIPCWGSIHPLGSYSMQSVGAAWAVSLGIGHNPGRVTTPTQDTSKMALILPTSEGWQAESNSPDINSTAKGIWTQDPRIPSPPP